MGCIDTFVAAGGLFARSSLKPGFINPPLGKILNFVFPLCLLIGITSTTLIPLLFRRKRVFGWLVLLGLVGSLGSSFVYVYAMQEFGRPIIIPQRNISDFVIGGSDRTDFAREYFGSSSDFEMLTSRGWGENDLFLYWSRESILRARTMILVSSVFALSFVNLMVAGAAAKSVPRR